MSTASGPADSVRLPPRSFAAVARDAPRHVATPSLSPRRRAPSSMRDGRRRRSPSRYAACVRACVRVWRPFRQDAMRTFDMMSCARGAVAFPRHRSRRPPGHQPAHALARTRKEAAVGHTHARARTHALVHPPTRTNPRTHARMHPRTQTRTHPRIHPPTRPPTHPRTAHPHARTHADTHRIPTGDAARADEHVESRLADAAHLGRRRRGSRQGAQVVDAATSPGPPPGGHSATFPAACPTRPRPRRMPL